MIYRNSERYFANYCTENRSGYFPLEYVMNYSEKTASKFENVT
jgi:hypothetical protein